MQPASYRVADLIVDTGRVRVSRAGVDIPLPRLSFDLLVALIRAAPNVVSVDDLMSRVWPGLVVSLETVSQRVKLLRDALGDDPKAPRYVAGVRGRGYRMIADVALVEASSPAPSAPLPDSATTPTEPLAVALPLPGPARDIDASRQQPSRFAWIAAVSAAIAIVIVGALYFRARVPVERADSSASGPKSEQVAVSALPIRSVAVLPFENLGSEPNDAIIAMGLAESVLHQLATQDQLTVIARTSSFAFAGKNIDARQIGQQLNARYLLEGSLQSANKRLRVFAQLIDSTTGTQIWSMQFDRKPDDLFEMQDEIAVSVRRALTSSVTVRATAAPVESTTHNLEAWIAYQQGRALVATRRKQDLAQAESRFAEAMRFDPSFAAAYTALAETRLLRVTFDQSDTWLYSFVRMPDEKAQAEVDRLLKRALELNPRDGHAYVVRAWSERDDAQAEKDFRHGLDLSPNDAVGYERFAKLLYFAPGPLGNSYHAEKRDESFAMAERARQIDPLSPNAHITKALMELYGRGNVEAANALLLQAISAEPNYYPALMRLAEVRWCCQGQLAEAVRLGEQALALEPQAAWPRHILEYMYLDLGDPAAAADVVATAAPTDDVATMGLHIYRREWPQACAIARGPLTTIMAIDYALMGWALAECVKASGVTADLRDGLESGAGVEWSAAGEPKFDPTYFSFDGRVSYAYFLQLTGDAVRARKLLERLLESMDLQSNVMKRGEIYVGMTRPSTLALLGRSDAAIAAMQAGMARKSTAHWWYRLMIDPTLDPLRGDPRFKALVAQWQRQTAAQRVQLAKLRDSGAVPLRPESAQIERSAQHP